MGELIATLAPESITRKLHSYCVNCSGIHLGLSDLCEACSDESTIPLSADHDTRPDYYCPSIGKMLMKLIEKALSDQLKGEK